MAIIYASFTIFFQSLGQVYQEKKKYPCEECNESFKFKNGLQKHVKIVHFRKKPFKCHICKGVGFRSKSGLNGHVIKFHEGKKPFACDVCDEGFLTGTDLLFENEFQKY